MARRPTTTDPAGELAAVRADIASAATVVDALLVDGKSTAVLRDRLAELRDREAELLAAIRLAADRAEAAAAEVLAERAGTIATESADRLAADALQIPEEISVPDTDFDHLAAGIAAAEHEHQHAAATLQAAQQYRDKIASRITALEAERAEIVRRRAAGDKHADDGGRLALLVADLEGLAALADKAAGDVAVARRPAEEALRVLAEARAALSRAEAEARQAALVAHAEALQAELSGTIARLAETQRALGYPRVAWGPTAEFSHAIRRLELQAVMARGHV